MDADIRQTGVEERFHFLQYGFGQRLTGPAAEVRQIRGQSKRLAVACPLHGHVINVYATGLYRSWADRLSQTRFDNLRLNGCVGRT